MSFLGNIYKTRLLFFKALSEQDHRRKRFLKPSSSRQSRSVVKRASGTPLENKILVLLSGDQKAAGRFV